MTTTVGHVLCCAIVKYSMRERKKKLCIITAAAMYTVFYRFHTCIYTSLTVVSSDTSANKLFGKSNVK